MKLFAGLMIFDILNGELVNGSFDHDTSLTCVRIHSDLYELFVIVFNMDSG